MTDIEHLSDRDLLVRIDYKLSVVDKDVTELKNRVTELERLEDRRTGFLSGAKWLWTVIATMPAAVVAYLVSHGPKW